MNRPPVSPIDPSVWPAPAKPYFMVVVDTSSNMNQAMVSAPPLCPLLPATRGGWVRCALNQVFQAYDGQVEFGVAGMALTQSGCSAACGHCRARMRQCIHGGRQVLQPGNVL